MLLGDDDDGDEHGYRMMMKKKKKKMMMMMMMMMMKMMKMMTMMKMIGVRSAGLPSAGCAEWSICQRDPGTRHYLTGFRSSCGGDCGPPLGPTATGGGGRG